MSDKYCVLQVAGGLGKHILATAVAQVIKRTHPDRKLICVVAWPELWQNLPFVDRCYQLGNTQYFYTDYVKDKDTLFFIQEPYFTTTHILKQLPLVESWCKLYGLDYQNEQPVVRINPEHKKAITNFYKAEKPILLLQTSGGMYNSERAYSWARDMPQDVAQKVVDHFKGDYQCMQVTRQNGYLLNDVYLCNKPLQNVELIGMLECTDKRLLIDSSLQHGAVALGLPSTVLWQATSPTIFGHKMHDNICAKPKEQEKLPGSYLFDYQFDSNDHEFPYDEDDLKDLYDIDRIIASIEAQGSETFPPASTPVTPPHPKGFQ